MIKIKKALALPLAAVQANAMIHKKRIVCKIRSHEIITCQDYNLLIAGKRIKQLSRVWLKNFQPCDKRPVQGHKVSRGQVNRKKIIHPGRCCQNRQA